MPSAAASPRPRPVNLVVKKGSKMRFEGRFVHSGAGVEDFETDVVARRNLAGEGGLGFRQPRRAGLHRDFARARYGLRRVEDEIHDQLLQLAGIGFDRRESVFQVESTG